MNVTLIIVFVPLFLLAALALIRQPAPIQFWMSALALGLAVVFMWLVFPWYMVSTWYGQLMPVFLVLAAYSGYRRIRKPEKPVAKWQALLNAGINLIMIVMMGVLAGLSVRGYPQPDGAIDLVSPLRGGNFVVSNGGSSPFINGHAKVRPQNHALDILALNNWGSRKSPFSDPEILSNYAIFDVPLYAPCEGEIVLLVDGLPDLIPPATNREQLAGNHVLIACQGVEVLLAHMKQGSIRVKAGQRVNTQTLLGNVGNSGNTSEPHLHIHAETAGNVPPLLLLDGEAVPITIEGRYLVRGSTL